MVTTLISYSPLSVTDSRDETDAVTFLALYERQSIDSHVLFLLYQRSPLRDERKAYHSNPTHAKMHELNLRREMVKVRM